jgi:O-antigen ligase
MLLSRAPLTLPAAPAGLYRAGWVASAVAIALVIAGLPLLHGLAVLGGAVLLGAAVWEPVVGLGLAMVLGPARAYLFVSFPTFQVDPGQVFFALAAAGWLARGLARRAVVVPRLPLLGPMAVYIAVGLVSLLGAVSLEEGFKEIVKWAEIGVAVVILATEAQRGRVRALLAFVLLAGLSQALLAIWQAQFRGTGPDHFRLADGSYRAYGTFEQPNPLGGFLGLIWPVAAGLAWGAVGPVATAMLRRLLAALSALSPRLHGAGAARDGRLPWPAAPLLWRTWIVASLLGLAAAFMLGGLYFSYSRGAWLGAAAAAVVLVASVPRRPWLGLALVAAAGLLAWSLVVTGLLPAGITTRLADITDFTTVEDVRGVEIRPSNFAVIERLAHWQAAAAMARDFPWLGVGLGNYGPVYPRYAMLNWPNALGHAHMIYLNVLAETGVIGLGAYLAFWGSVLALNLGTIGRADGLARGLAMGLLGAWAHLSVHQLVDNLYVNNIPFVLAGLISLLIYLAGRPRGQGASVLNL